MELTEGLARLGKVRAPEGFAERVLAAADRHAIVQSELGKLLVTLGPGSIAGVRLATRADRHLRLEELPARLRRRFDLSRLNPFQQAVLRKTLEIPRGEVRPYSWVAAEIGQPRAVRAVGTALATNPIPYFIPCHRVVRSDGVIGNYGLGGTEYKRRILSAEGADPDGLEKWARQGVRFHGSRTTHVYCFPTCRNARRIGDANRVGFASPASAEAAGYRACQVCRPRATIAA